MKKPVSRWWWSTGFRARAWTSIRSSFGPGVGVWRVVGFIGVFFDGRVAASWVWLEVDMMMVMVVMVGGELR